MSSTTRNKTAGKSKPSFKKEFNEAYEKYKSKPESLGEEKALNLIKSLTPNAMNSLPEEIKKEVKEIKKGSNNISPERIFKSFEKTAKALISGASRAPSVNLKSELNAIDFRKMIGGPLQACVDAQVASALTTVNFINEVGFVDDGTGSGKRELVMVDFSHKRTDLKEDGTPVVKEVNIRIPLLAMLPIPSLRIEHAIIVFNVKLNSVETSEVKDTLKVDTEVKGGWGPVSMKVSASFQRQSTTGVDVKKEYTLNVNVKAVQDEIPAGLEKILNMLAA